ncbi:MAG: protoporphyrinogen oxidase [Actinomycetota bacterium]|nr:protoporphyrinogen oxidase [Actinomycetota bacterium]
MSAPEAQGTTVAIVGGGISGLAAAWEIVSRPSGSGSPAKVVVFDAAERTGGKIRTGTVGPVEGIDLGPDAFVTRNSAAVELCRELGLGDDLVAPAAAGAFVWARGALRRLPSASFLGVPTRLAPLAQSGIVSRHGVARAGLDLVLPRAALGASARADRSVASIVAPRLGAEVARRLVDPIVGGIHAGSTHDMSAAAVFPELLDAARSGGSLMRALGALRAGNSDPRFGEDGEAPLAPPPIFQSLRGGLERLVDALTRSLRERGVTIHTGAPVTALERQETAWRVVSAATTTDASAVVLATPAAVSAQLLAPHAPPATAALRAIDAASVAIVTLAYRRADVARSLHGGTGYLVPDEGARFVTACTWLTTKWAHLANQQGARDLVVVRASVGRIDDERFARMDDGDLVAKAHAEIARHMGIRRGPVAQSVTRWEGAFPQYRVGHLDRVAMVESAVASTEGIAVCGACLSGVGIPACIAEARRSAAALMAGGTTRAPS